MIGIRSTIRIMPMMSNTIPERTILVIGISPEPYTTAFCGVDTGSMNPKEAPKTAASARGEVSSGASGGSCGLK
jgi:hypothetical protein